MAGTGGYLYWDDRFLRDAPYLDGLALSRGYLSLDWDESDVLAALPTHAGTTILQALDMGTGSPDIRVAYTFSVNRAAVGEEEYRAVRRAKSKGRAVYWCPYVWATETFQVVSGSSYTLTRPLARGIVAGVTALTHPEAFELDGASAPSAATITGQTLTAADTGELVVRYLPAFRVIMPGVSNSVPDVNGLDYSLQLQEVVSLS